LKLSLLFIDFVPEICDLIITFNIRDRQQWRSSIWMDKTFGDNTNWWKCIC